VRRGEVRWGEARRGEAWPASQGGVRQSGARRGEAGRGIPEAGPDEAVLVDGADSAPAGVAALTRAGLAAATSQAARSKDREDQLAALVGGEIDPLITDWVEKIQQLVDTAPDLEHIRQGLLDLLPSMSADQFTRAMQHALAIGGAAGMFDALEDSRG